MPQAPPVDGRTGIITPAAGRASVDSPTGRRYVEHEARGHSILLFVREHRDRHGLSVPFVFLGPARYVGHTGSRPMSITWELLHPLPARLYRQLARLAVA